MLSANSGESEPATVTKSLMSWSSALVGLGKAARRFGKGETQEGSSSETDTDVPSEISPCSSLALTVNDSDSEFVYSRSIMMKVRPMANPDDADTVHKQVCKAKLCPLTYENIPSKSKTVAPVRHHKKPAKASLPLSPSADSWVAQKRNSSSSNLDEDEKVGRAARSILNKITAETFDSLFQQLVGCGIEKPQHISKLMSEVFDTATKQHHFIPMYADLCVRLEKDPCIASVVEAAGQLHNFRRLLLNQCQVVFEQLLEPCAAEQASDEEVCLRRKQEALGNIKLIGHLLVRGMLSSKLLVECAQELIGKRTTCLEALESLAALMTVAAPTFDTAEWQHHDKLDACFTNMRKLAKDKTMAPRSRFLLRDVLDVREARWPTSTKNPAVIHAEQSGNDMLMDFKGASEVVAATPSSKCDDSGRGAPFDLKVFRRNLAAILTDLTSDRNVAEAVRRVRVQAVPKECQAEQFADILTRVVEEKRGPPRRCAMAFAAGIAAAEHSAFDRDQCLAGLMSFFQDVYPDLCDEVPRLPAIIRSELTPTFCSVFPRAEINTVLPPGVRF